MLGKLSYLNNCQVDWVFHHNCFIYGYDSDDEIFYMQGYLTDGKWENITVPFDLFYESVKSKIKCGSYEISGCKLISEYEWKFDFVKMKQQILDYVDMKKLIIDDNLIYNLDGCSLFFCRLNENIEIHIPSIYCMYEHMKIMVRRIQFLYDNDFMICDDELIEMATVLEKRYKSLLLLAIKYTTMQSKKILSKIKARGLEAIDLEKKLMLYFCDMLDN